MRKTFKARQFFFLGTVATLGLLDAALIKSSLKAIDALVTNSEVTLVADNGFPTVNAERRVSDPPALLLTEEQSRPLFAATRRPLPPEAVAVEAVPEEVPPSPFMWSVAGIVASKKIASVLFRKADNVTEEWHKVGDVMDGWTVEAVDMNRVTVRLNTMSTTLKLYYSEPKK